MKSRSRPLYAALFCAVVALGLASRAPALRSHLPSLVSRYAGDTLWALAVFVVLAFAFPHASTRRTSLTAFGVALAVEISQIAHPAWLDAVRGTRLGGLLLGFDFLWSDLACYAGGILLGAGLDAGLRRRVRSLSAVPRIFP